MIAYKVVTNDRKSAFVSKHVNAATLQYLEGTVVEANPDTMGIFCFKTRDEARRWMNKECHGNVILKVEGVGKPRQPRFAISDGRGIETFFDFILSSDLSKSDYRRLFMTKEKRKMGRRYINVSLGTRDNEIFLSIRKIPTGTITFRKIRVLE